MRKLLLLLLLVPAVGFAESLRVFASVVPVQTFVQKCGGKHVDARAMVRPGFNPRTYDPTPHQISALAGTVLYVRIGVPYENAWMERIRSANPGVQVLDARNGITLRAMEAHSHDNEEQTERHRREADGTKHRQHADGHDPDHDKHVADAAHVDEPDPHVWTSPPLVKHIVGMICDKLSELDPAHAAEFARNHDAFVAELDALDRELHALLDPLAADYVDNLRRVGRQFAQALKP